MSEDALDTDNRSIDPTFDLYKDHPRHVKIMFYS